MDRVNNFNMVKLNMAIRGAGINHAIARNNNLTPDQRQARLNFAKANLNRDWTKVIFSDEKKYQTSVNACVWGCISIGGPLEITFIPRPLNRFNYIEILEEVLLPTLEISYESERMVFMQDNCLVHTSAVVRKWFENHKEIELLSDWPAKSYDLNPIEDVWAKTTDLQLASNHQDLRNAILRKWENLRGNTQFFENLYGSMHGRLQEVIDNDGGLTSY